MPPTLHRLRAAAIAGIVVRNVVPVVGMVAYGWRAPHLVLLYYVDTMVSIASVFTLLFMYGKDMPLDPRQPKQLAGAVVGLLALVGVFGAVFGMPLLFVSMMDTIEWSDEDLRVGLLVQLLLGCTAFLTMSRELRVAKDPELLIRARWGYVTMRWFAVFAVGTFVPWAPLLVISYVVASAWLEIRPPPADPPPA